MATTRRTCIRTRRAPGNPGSGLSSQLCRCPLRRERRQAHTPRWRLMGVSLAQQTLSLAARQSPSRICTTSCRHPRRPHQEDRPLRVLRHPGRVPPGRDGRGDRADALAAIRARPRAQGQGAVALAPLQRPPWPGAHPGQIGSQPRRTEPQEGIARPEAGRREVRPDGGPCLPGSLHRHRRRALGRRDPAGPRLRRRPAKCPPAILWQEDDQAIIEALGPCLQMGRSMSVLITSVGDRRL